MPVSEMTNVTTCAALLSVRTGYEAAVAAALGGAADAVAVTDVDAALGAIGHLKADDLGRAGILLGGARVDDAQWPGLAAGATYAIDVIECPAELRPALSRLLFKVAVVEDLGAYPVAAALFHEEHIDLAGNKTMSILGRLLLEIVETQNRMMFTVLNGDGAKVARDAAEYEHRHLIELIESEISSG